MSTDHPQPSPDVAHVQQHLPPPNEQAVDGLSPKASTTDAWDDKFDMIEMLGEELGAEFTPPTDGSQISAGMRYLHSSRTIQQLVTDRNRVVGLYLAIATLLWTASTALLNADPVEGLLVPLDILKKWCLPFTFGVLTVLALLVSLLLIRTRVGLIYEVAKMNVLLGLPLGRVKRVNVLSIFFLMHLIIALAGGCSAGFLTVFLLRMAGWELHTVALPLTGLIVGVVITSGLVALYVITILNITSDKNLQDGVK